MGLDIFFADDVRRALMAADEAVSSTARVYAAVGGYEASPEADVVLRAYLEGYRAALTTVALAFGLSPSIITGRRETLEMQARTVGEALPIGEEDDASLSARPAS